MFTPWWTSFEEQDVVRHSSGRPMNPGAFVIISLSITTISDSVPSNAVVVAVIHVSRSDVQLLGHPPHDTCQPQEDISQRYGSDSFRLTNREPVNPK